MTLARDVDTIKTRLEEGPARDARIDAIEADVAELKRQANG